MDDDHLTARDHFAAKALTGLIYTAPPSGVGDDPVRRWTTLDLAGMFPGTATQWLRYATEAERAGVLTKRGKYWFARQSEIESWLTGAGEKSFVEQAYKFADAMMAERKRPPR